MKRLILAIIACTSLISCDQSSISGHTDNTTSKTTTPTNSLEIKSQRQEPVAEAKTKEEEIYGYPCAIFTEPTKKQIDSLKKVYSEQEYSRIVDDNLYYITTARNFFESKGLKIVNKKPLGVVKFRKADGNIAEMEINNFFWGIVLFNGKSEPIEVDLTTIEEEYDRYMK